MWYCTHTHTHTPPPPRSLADCSLRLLYRDPPRFDDAERIRTSIHGSLSIHWLFFRFFALGADRASPASPRFGLVAASAGREKNAECLGIN